MLEKTPLLGPVAGVSSAPSNAIEVTSYSAAQVGGSEHSSSSSQYGSEEDESPAAPEVHIAHSIGAFPSFALIMNNLTGPAMLGFPALFQQAGVLPVVGGIMFVYLTSSLCGTLLGESLLRCFQVLYFDHQ